MFAVTKSKHAKFLILLRQKSMIFDRFCKHFSKILMNFKGFQKPRVFDAPNMKCLSAPNFVKNFGGFK
jgi:hypothetical protein